MKGIKAVLIALVFGAAIGLFFAIVTEGGFISSGTGVKQIFTWKKFGETREEEKEPEVADGGETQSIEEAAEEKSTQAASVDDVDMTQELQSGMDALDYPLHDYDLSAFDGEENGPRYYADTEHYISRFGIDVSEHNGQIDWEQVRLAGYSFAFIRLGYRGYEEGKLNLDARFYENLEGAKAAGLDVGVYFFAQALDREEAISEAEFVLEHLGDTELQLPVIYDPEAIPFDEARTDQTTGTQFSENTKVFCDAIRASGYEAGYYANLKWEVFMMDMNLLDDYTVWYAGYEAVPSTPYRFSFWQYSDQGAVPGISAATDLNLQMIPVE